MFENLSDRLSGGAWRVDVTLCHTDSGREHYANGWPPMTQAPTCACWLSRIKILEAVPEVTIRARDNVNGWTVETYMVTLP